MNETKQKCSGEHGGTKLLCSQRFDCAKYCKHHTETVFALKDKCEYFERKIRRAK